MSCPTDEELLAFARGRLDPEPRAEIEAHLDTCSTCLAGVAALAASTLPSAERDDVSSRAPRGESGQPRYVLEGEIARGGMGRIFAAQDLLLGRRVAIKRVRTGGTAAAQRFEREQRITARLQHPAIIPIYDAGVLEDGGPFLAMRLVEGESLDRVVAKTASLEERLRLLPAAIAAVNAVAYAHSKGIVHRDLKPQNVLVGAFGEVVVLDWGLARELAAEAPAPDEPPDPTEAPHVADVVSADTAEGTVLGTPAYMAPEQAEGRLADERSDVFGLGAMLHHVLSGRSPIQGLRDGERTARPLPAAVPADLAAIVTRAMDPEPSRRYASAGELAEDLERWESGRLVEAHRYSVGELLARFARRYRAPLLVAAAAVVLIAILATLSVRRIVDERTHAIAEGQRAEEARAAAEKHRAAAENLVGFVLGDLRGRLQRIGRLEVLAGVAGAVATYQEESPTADDAAALHRQADVSGLAGDVALALGDLDRARASYQQSLDAAARADRDGGAPLVRCRAAVGLGGVLKQRGEHTEAAALFEGCVETLRRLDGPASDELRVRSAIALADLARIAGDLPKSREILEQARPVATLLVAEAGGPGADVSELLYRLQSDLVQTYYLAGEVVEAEAEAHSVASFAEKRRAARMDDANARYDRATAIGLLGLLKQHVGDWANGERLLLEAIEEHRKLSESDPTNAKWLRAVSVDADRIGDYWGARDEPERALPWLTESRDLAMKLTELAPDDFEWQRDVGISELKLGYQLKALRRLDDARAALDRGLAIYERLAKVAPEAKRAEREMAVVLSALADLEVSARRLDAARGHATRGVALLEAQLAQADTPSVRQDLAGLLVLLGDHDPGDGARAFFERAAEVLLPIRSRAEMTPSLAEVCTQVDDRLRKPRE